MLVLRAGFFPVNRMRNEIFSLPVAVGFGGAGACRHAPGSLASSAVGGCGRALIPLDKIGFVFHYFFYLFLARGRASDMRTFGRVGLPA
jgi:hypothetical protein